MARHDAFDGDVEVLHAEVQEEVVARAAGEEAELHLAPAPRAEHAVGHLADGAVAADGEDARLARGRDIMREVGGVAGTFRRDEARLDAARAEPRLRVERALAAAPVAARGIVHERDVAQRGVEPRAGSYAMWCIATACSMPSRASRTRSRPG